MKYKTVEASGHWEDEPNRNFDVTIALGSWDGELDAEDEEIFFYMDGEPLTEGTVIGDGFVVTKIER